MENESNLEKRLEDMAKQIQDLKTSIEDAKKAKEERKKRKKKRRKKRMKKIKKVARWDPKGDKSLLDVMNETFKAFHGNKKWRHTMNNDFFTGE